MVLPVALHVQQTQVVRLRESLPVEIQGNRRAVQVHQHQQRVHLGQLAILSLQVYLYLAQQPRLVGLSQYLLEHLRRVVRMGQLVGARLPSTIQCVCRGRWSDRVYAFLLTQQVLGLSYRALIVHLWWACALLGGIPQCRQGPGSYAVPILASNTVILSYCTHFIECEHLSSHLPSVIESYPHTVIDLSASSVD